MGKRALASSVSDPHVRAFDCQYTNVCSVLWSVDKQHEIKGMEDGERQANHTHREGKSTEVGNAVLVYCTLNQRAGKGTGVGGSAGRERQRDKAIQRDS